MRVPIGTVVHDLEADEVLADLAKRGARFVVARGGRGGRGNASLSSAVERAPSFAEHGEPGEERPVLLDLRIAADVGFLGMPNAGKSTLLRALSSATPKVGDYPFTTLEPSLGVVEPDPDSRFTAADLPGLIEGAAGGRGLGTRFLRHAERCAVLAAVVDMASPDPALELTGVLTEVRAYEEELAERVKVVVGNKADLPDADPGPAHAWADAHGMRFTTVSALHRRGTEELAALLGDLVAAARAERPEAESFAVFRPVAPDRLLISREGGGFRVSSTRVERLVAMTPMSNPRAVRHLQRRLNAMGVESALQREGAEEGDDVYIGSVTFEFHPG